MMQLTDRIHLVGGGPFSGFGLTAAADSHVYLVDGGSELALVDVGLGMPEAFDQLVANITAAGFDPASIGHVLLTHYHADHAAAAAAARARFGAQVAIAAEAADAVERGDEQATGLAAARDAGVFPTDARFPPCPVDRRLSDGDVVEVGDAQVTFVTTPGHCAGHGSYLLDGVDGGALFAGDAVFWAGRILLQAVPDCDLQAAMASLRRLAELEFEAFLPGHGALTVAGGALHTELAVGELDRLAVPKGIV